MTAAAAPTTQTAATMVWKVGIFLRLVAFSLQSQPLDIARRVAERETAALEARAHYTYRQTVTIEEVSPRGGLYREVREVIFSPTGDRTERFVGNPTQNLVRLRLTEEDFRDIREVQPFLFTPEVLWLYQTRPRGEDSADGVDCWLLEVRPRQTHQSQRMFDGLFWVDKRDLSVIKTEGVAVPQILRYKNENLFPRFTTFREKLDGHSFPVHTHSDDTLAFSSGAIRMRMSIRYTDYKRFSARSTVTFHP